MFTIVISEKGGSERRESFDKPEVNVGRVQGNDLMLPKGNVSKHHARLLYRDGRFIVTDLKSTNGTYVNGRKIAQATIVREGDKIYVGHVGDSRVYRVRENGIAQLTRDHSLLEDYKDARPDMSEEEAKNFPHKNVITRALGMRDHVMVDITKVDLQNGDRYVLCSDGLSGMLTDDEIHEIIHNSKDLEDAVSTLIDRANEAGGTDNITAMVVECNF